MSSRFLKYGHVHVHEHGKDHIPADKVGIALSIVCLIHCLLGPILLIFLPQLSKSLGHEYFHWIILLLIVPIAAWSFIKSYQSHKIVRPLQLGVVGVMFLVLGILIPELLGGHTHEIESSALSLESLETAFTVLGGMILAYAHYVNLKQCQCRH